MNDKAKQKTTDEVLDAMPVLARAELDMQVATARTYPRDMRKFLNELTSLATISEPVAAEMSFALKRRDREGGDKVIVGPSIRFAELVALTWTNCRVGARIVEQTDQFIVAQGVFMDLERNVAHTSEVRRRIVDKNGRRYNVDLIGVTANAACAIAKRNATFAGVAKALWNPAWDAACNQATGDLAKSLDERRTQMLTFLSSLGVSEGAILNAVDVKSVADIGANELFRLRGLMNAMKEGEQTLRDAFPEPGEQPAEETKGVASVRDRIMGGKAAGTTAASTPADDAPDAAPPDHLFGD